MPTSVVDWVKLNQLIESEKFREVKLFILNIRRNLPLKNMNIRDLRVKAQNMGITNYSRMSKDELVEEIIRYENYST